MTFSPAKPEIVFVVAIADNGVIGQGNAMPWHLRSDLQRFRAMTWGLPLVMGRKTFQSIGKALPGRTNIVVTRDANFRASGAVVAHTLEQAMNLARGDTLRRGASAIAVIGGGLSAAAPLFLSAVLAELNGTYATPEGGTRRRLVQQAFNLEDSDQLAAFLRGATREIAVPGTDRRLAYDPLARIGVGVSRLGTSEAIALGAHAFALQQLDAR